MGQHFNFCLVEVFPIFFRQIFDWIPINRFQRFEFCKVKYIREIPVRALIIKPLASNLFVCVRGVRDDEKEKTMNDDGKKNV